MCFHLQVVPPVCSVVHCGACSVGVLVQCGSVGGGYCSGGGCGASYGRVVDHKEGAVNLVGRCLLRVMQEDSVCCEGTITGLKRPDGAHNLLVMSVKDYLMMGFTSSLHICTPFLALRTQAIVCCTLAKFTTHSSQHCQNIQTTRNTGPLSPLP